MRGSPGLLLKCLFGGSELEKFGVGGSKGSPGFINTFVGRTNGFVGKDGLSCDAELTNGSILGRSVEGGDGGISGNPGLINTLAGPNGEPPGYFENALGSFNAGGGGSESTVRDGGGFSWLINSGFPG